MNKVLLIPALGAFLFSATAMADDAQDYVPDASAETTLDTGWDGFLNLGATINGTTNNSVIGQDDGQVWNLGLQLNGMLEYLVGGHEWRNSLGYVVGVAQTTQIDRFVKNADHFQFESLYFYHLPNPSWLGPFARAQMDTAFFSGSNVRAQDAHYSVTDIDGASSDEVSDNRQITTAFAPLILRESVGFFAQPIVEEALSLDIRLGVGARQVSADGQFYVSDIADNGHTTDAGLVMDEITVSPLESYTQVGLESVIAATGLIEDGRVSYNASAEVMIPFINSLDTGDETPMDLANYELLAGLSFKLVEWASVDFRVGRKIEPQLLDEWQTTTNLLLTFTQTLVSASAAE